MRYFLNYFFPVSYSRASIDIFLSRARTRYIQDIYIPLIILTLTSICSFLMSSPLFRLRFSVFMVSGMESEYTLAQMHVLKSLKRYCCFQDGGGNCFYRHYQWEQRNHKSIMSHSNGQFLMRLCSICNFCRLW